MCGIFGVIGSREVSTLILDGLRKLEYRGYDSAGLATIHNTKNNQSGELIYSGKNVCLGYANSVSDLSKGDDNNGIFKTGDIAKRDKDNFYYIVGRKDRFVKIYGNRVNLAELENNILKFGIQSICKVNEENKITIFIQKNKEQKKLRESISNFTSLNVLKK